ncbi:M3 family metallopeptidase [Halochromatium glycolicum]|uniref:oligopeptidase A n=1 Tax=Halochromatium glycolicum TaxID=85075 RepID=A0AAJ0U2P4_9GAMM|nr:M3 family metallopeptidase [Halochromatium glycolicum]MBK1704184.1 oligopeptidase A [Halochromatium glycolicum]
MDNPLLDAPPLPAFSRIRPEHVEPAIDRLIADGRALVAALTENADQVTWENFVEPLEAEDDRLSRAWSPVSHLNSVMNSDELRAAYNACLPKLSDYATEVGQNPDLYRAYQRVSEQSGLDPAQRKMLSNTLRDLHLAGVDLPLEKKARYRAIAQELSQLTNKFAENVLDATNAWHKHLTDESALAGLPDAAKALARQHAKERELDGWVLTLDFPSFEPVMRYADDRALRREVYEAFTTRASDQGPDAGRFDNGEVMERLLALRHEQAQLLGFSNFAELSLAPKMARSTGEVMAFLNDLAEHSVDRARAELDEVKTYALTEHGFDDLQPWDLSYYSEKLRQHRYAISDEELKPYFPFEGVVSGMFAVAERLFDVRIERAETGADGSPVDLWHPDVRFYRILDEADRVRAEFYLDPFARRRKQGGAWMNGAVSRMRMAGHRQHPVAHLVCNFTPPVDGHPSLLTHREVETLFHEFGHGLHHMLTRVDFPPVAGIHGVPWDAVELPSQFLENWCWERQSLDLFAAHHETGARIPDDLFERMTAAKNFQSAMQMVRQLEFALFDFRLHLEYDPAAGGQVYEVLDQVRDQVAVLKPPAANRFAHGFSHIFAGGYAAGYYSYKWAEVLSADAFSLFEERGIFDPPTGHAFREQILERGGSAEAMDLYVAFRGREPTVDALLRHSGIAA